MKFWLRLRSWRSLNIMRLGDLLFFSDRSSNAIEPLNWICKPHANVPRSYASRAACTRAHTPRSLDVCTTVLTSYLAVGAASHLTSYYLTVLGISSSTPLGKGLTLTTAMAMVKRASASKPTSEEVNEARNKIKGWLSWQCRYKSWRVARKVQSFNT
ncbi:hypothetical protein F4861DRAFT_179435 [Xylaria intraflava]|nr:hypothetical protein F4861DRAFT_179435 [Xylaria intraflava]